MILHVTTRAAWDEAQRGDSLRADSLDREGFIHCCTGAQLTGVLARFFQGQRELVVLEIDESKLSVEVKWEPPAESPGSVERFPHVYGVIDVRAVVGARPLDALCGG